ncbi:fumarylacetoacetate hydrolase family protein [Lichenicoccus sp.]|uniref:fumarylacetoacetate hydrolase family protein n=1 Tax=Lichenicoccus sp. TaxID=2781899 RepID=UPI003D146F82
MKLLRYRHNDDIKVGALLDDRVLYLGSLGFETMSGIIEGGEAALDRIAAHISSARVDAAVSSIALADVTLLAPLERPSKYLAIGMNYGKHVEESNKLGVARSKHQVWFNKQTSCICGPHDDIDPGVTEKLDYEVELGFVIGKQAKCISENDARDYVFGYLVANDVSARDWQFHSSTFTMGKSFDTHGPIGPWIVTADEIPDPHALALRCYVNGELRQDSVTSCMIANVWQQIAYLSLAFTLYPGDLIATGTPEGVGIGMDPQTFLRPGDVVRCEIDRIGAIQNTVVAPSRERS